MGGDEAECEAVMVSYRGSLIAFSGWRVDNTGKYIHKKEGAPTQARSCLFSQPRPNPFHLSAVHFYFITSFHQNKT